MKLNLASRFMLMFILLSMMNCQTPKQVVNFKGKSIYGSFIYLGVLNQTEETNFTITNIKGFLNIRMDFVVIRLIDETNTTNLELSKYTRTGTLTIRKSDKKKYLYIYRNLAKYSVQIKDSQGKEYFALDDSSYSEKGGDSYTIYRYMRIKTACRLTVDMDNLNVPSGYSGLQVAESGPTPLKYYQFSDMRSIVLNGQAGHLYKLFIRY